MKKHDMTVHDYLGQCLSVPHGGLPLSSCRVLRPYLLEKVQIPVSGTAFMLAIPYLVASDAEDATRNISLYAVPRDYHIYVKSLEQTLIPQLEKAFPPYRRATLPPPTLFRTAARRRFPCTISRRWDCA